MAEAIVPQERLLYATYSPPHVYEDGTDDGQPIVTALFREPPENGGLGYAIREYSLPDGAMFYRFPTSGGHWSRAVIRQEWYRGTETRLPDWVGFRGHGRRPLRGAYRSHRVTKWGTG
jgi:hypothetical protein